MKRVWLLLLFLLCTALSAEESRHSSLFSPLSEEPLELLGGCIDPISGIWIDQEVDLEIPNSGNFNIARTSYSLEEGFYSTRTGKWEDRATPPLYMWSRWGWNHGFLFYHQPYERHRATRLSNLNGQIMHFSHEAGGKGKLMDRHFTSWSNSSGGVIGAAFDLHNTKVEIRKSPDKGDEWVVTESNGVERSFTSHRTSHGKGSSHVWHSCESERKFPQGIRWTYTYKDPFNIDKIHLLARNAKCMGSLLFIDRKGTQIRSSTGDWVKYELTDKYRGFEGLPVGVERSQKPSISYEYHQFVMSWKVYHITEGKLGECRYFLPPVISCKRFPNNRYRSMEYIDTYPKNHQVMAGASPIPGPHAGKIARYFGPVGPAGEKLLIYNLEYSENSTTVWDGVKNKRIYNFDDKSRLTSLQLFDDRDRVQQTQHLRWSKSPVAGRLIQRWLEDPTGQTPVLYCYDYDAWGNVVKECVYGKLLSESAYPKVDSKGLVTNATDCDSYTTSYEYIQIPYHLKTAENHPDGKRIEYLYESDSDRKIAQFTLWKGEILERKFWTYDEFAQVSFEISDDGTTRDPSSLVGVHQRKMTRTLRYSEGPSIGLMSEQTTSYLDLESLQECQLLRHCYSYDRHRHMTLKHIWDCVTGANNKEQYKHDLHGNCIEEIDSRGALIKRLFDANDNLIEERGPHQEVVTRFDYDLDNRLVMKTSIYPDVTLRESYEYDAMGRQTAKVDPYGVRSSMKYDYANHLIEERIDGLLSTDGSLMTKPLVTSQEYDLFGRVTKSIDELGYASSTTYNWQGSPLSECKSNGTRVDYRYNREGQLIAKRYNDTYEERFVYDGFGRVAQVILDAEVSGLLSLQIFYEGAQKVRQIDALGHEDLWGYDGAGRIKWHERIDANSGAIQREEFTYDGNDRVLTHRHLQDCHLQDETSFIEDHFVYNSSGDIVEQWTTNQTLEKSHYTVNAYDSLGKLKSQGQRHNDKLAMQIWDYNSHGDLIRYIDPESYITVYNYEYLAKGMAGSLGTRIEKTKPTGDREIIWNDSRALLTHMESWSAEGELAQHQDLAYDGAHHLTQRIEWTLAAGENVADPLITRVVYGPEDQLLARWDAVGTAIERPRTWSYDQTGHCIAKLEPSGLIHNYSYDMRGRLIRSWTLDSSIDYSYSYDELDCATQVYNGLTQRSTSCQFDAWSQVISETLENGWTYQRRYNGLGQIEQEIYPDGSTLQRSYKGGRLQTVERQAVGLTYTHTLSSYDDWGHTTLEQMPYALGSIVRTYDGQSRLIHLARPGYQVSSIHYDPLSRLIQRCITRSSDPFTELYSYDSLDQLTHESGLVESRLAESSHFDHSYQCDSRRRRLQVDDETYAEDALDQLVTIAANSEPICFFEYDLDGDLLSFTKHGDSWQLVYDGWHRPIRLVGPGVDVTYSYDAFDRRVSKMGQVKGKSVDELYGYIDRRLVSRQIMASQVSASQVSALPILEHRLFIRGDSSEQDDTMAWERDGVVLLPVLDMGGSTVGWIDTLGDLKGSWSYDAFGIAGGSTLGPWGFGSKFIDEESGFLYFGRRYYIPSWGRWLTRDPKGEIDGSNVYAYVLNNPLNKLDLWGLQSEPSADSTRNICDRWNSYYNEGGFTSHCDLAFCCILPFYDFARSAFYLSDDHPESWANLSGWSRAIHIGFLGLDAFGVGEVLKTGGQVIKGGAALAKGCGVVANVGIGAETKAMASVASKAISSGATTQIVKNGTAKIEKTASRVIADSRPGGSLRAPLEYAPYQKARNASTSINGREYSGHALDRMQDRGLFPSVIENTIKNGQASPSRLNRVNYYDAINRVKVTVEESGKIVTVIPGRG